MVAASGSGNGEVIGSLGAGTFLQQTGANNLTGNGSLVLGSGSGGTGFYQLSAGSLAVGAGETIGGVGNGTFTQFGGSHSVGGVLTLGNSGIGDYELHSGGTLTVTNGETIANQGIGTFIQQGGLNQSQAGMIISQNGGTGAYVLSGGTVLVTGPVFTSLSVGLAGVGTFNQSGGLVQVGTSDASIGLNVGTQTGGTGVYSMSGTGILTVNGSISVGANGVGTFAQSGGTVNATSLSIGGGGTVSAASGTYSLGPGGVLNVSSFGGESVSAGGTFLQTGGIHTVGSAGVVSSDNLSSGLSVNTGGDYRLSGGTLDVYSEDAIAGTFEQTGGLHHVHGLMLIGNTNAGDPPATYLLTSGTLLQTSIPIINPTDFSLGTFGFMLIVNGGTLAAGASGFLNADAHLQGGVVSGVLHNQGTFSFEVGTFSAQLQNDGTFLLNSNTLTGTQTTNNELGILNGPGTIAGFTSNQGVINCNGVLATGTLNNAGLVNVGTNSSLQPGAMSNTGQITLTRGAISGAGSVVTSGNGIIAGGGTISLSLIQNGGSLIANIPDSPLNINGPISIGLPSTQLIIAPGCTMRFANGLFNTAFITLQGPGATLTGAGSFLNTGTISGVGQINNQFGNGGMVRVTGGELVLTGTGDSNSGTFNATAGGTISVNNGLTSNTGSIVLSSGASTTARRR